MTNKLICTACVIAYAGALYFINAPSHTIEVANSQTTLTATTTATSTMLPKVVQVTKPLKYTSRAREGNIGISREIEVRKYFEDIPVMAEISRCESGFIHLLYDGSVLTGKVDPRDLGVMQINTGYHAEEAKKLGLDLTKFEDNMAYARSLYTAEGTKPWLASARCWHK